MIFNYFLKHKRMNIHNIKKYCDKHYKKSIDEEMIKMISLRKPSTIKRYKKMYKILHDELNDDHKCKKLIDKMLNIFIISPQSIGSLRGYKFNCIVEKKLKSLKWLNSVKFEVDSKFSDERVDWIIEHEGSVIIGMNQLDLWSGGAQLNRGGKYILSHKKSDEYSLLSVVYNKPDKKYISTNKAFKILKVGIESDILCYVENIEPTLRRILKLDIEPKEPILEYEGFGNFFNSILN